MEQIEQLVIESIRILKEGHKKDGTPYIWYGAKTQNGYYTFYDLAISPGESGTFRTVTEQGDKIDPKTGEPYINKRILGYAGPIDNYPAKPFRTSTEPKPADSSIARLEAAVANWEQKFLEYGHFLENLEERVSKLETPAIDHINPKADPGSPF